MYMASQVTGGDKVNIKEQWASQFMPIDEDIESDETVDIISITFSFLELHKESSNSWFNLFLTEDISKSKLDSTPKFVASYTSLIALGSKKVTPSNFSTY